MSGNSKSNAWSVEDSRNLYHIGRWGADYFDVNDNGHVICRPRRSGGAAVALPDIIEEAKRRGLRFPLLVRFQDILRDRVEALNGAFSKAIVDFGYTGRYRGVFPVKVNQLREVVEEILDAGRPFEYGLEVGSKTELFAGSAGAFRRAVSGRTCRILRDSRASGSALKSPRTTNFRCGEPVSSESTVRRSERNASAR